MKRRSSIANEAAFEPTDRNAVTGVGAPSYTSGAHMWNGTAAILNPMPAARRIMPRLSTRPPSCAASATAISSSRVEPVAP